MQENELTGLPSPLKKKSQVGKKEMCESSNAVTYSNILYRRLRKHPQFFRNSFAFF